MPRHEVFRDFQAWIVPNSAFTDSQRRAEEKVNAANNQLKTSEEKELSAFSAHVSLCRSILPATLMHISERFETEETSAVSRTPTS